MSNTANWSYTNFATVRPFIKFDQWDGGEVYGDPYEIQCTWIIKAEPHKDADGNEFISTFEIYTEDRRPKYKDEIKLGEHPRWMKIRSVTEWDMSFFDEEPDLKLVT